MAAKKKKAASKKKTTKKAAAKKKPIAAKKKAAPRKKKAAAKKKPAKKVSALAKKQRAHDKIEDRLLAEFQPHEIAHLAKKHGLSRNQVAAVVARLGGHRVKVEAALEQLKASPA